MPITEGIRRQSASRPPVRLPSVKPTPNTTRIHVTWRGVSRAEVTAAKARAEAFTAQAYAECPDLKPGELRHPGAVARCARMHEEAAEAVRAYEQARKDALAAGITVP